MARGRFTFWLDYSKDEELLLAETIDDLKRRRSFSSTIRIGIEIVCDLRKGNLDALFRHFPWVKAEWTAHTTQTQNSRENALQAQLERLEKLLIAQGNTPVAMPQFATPALSTGPQKLDVPKFDLPTFDDDEDDMDTVVIKKDTRTDAAHNFLRSLSQITS